MLAQLVIMLVCANICDAEHFFLICDKIDDIENVDACFITIGDNFWIRYLDEFYTKKGSQLMGR